ncbi:FAD-binding domain-containing protein [Penicillium daleae]|uniref:FAD-binding domain-containing protein n=1 Tax=Penicillium daleae TaxID=63821 RepID=A0AAD6C788_9EURO|nr:FAD-binding domain-containing protein [Penicillium daleae]KAJ5453915.1 FAD-binding domain-containing protein [Penicillium daleae]
MTLEELDFVCRLRNSRLDLSLQPGYILITSARNPFIKPFLTYKRAIQLRQNLQDTEATVITPIGKAIRSLSIDGARPGAVVIVTSSHEISLVITFATCHYIPFVVQGGGFSTSGASSTHGGIVINLSIMRSIVVDLTSQTVAVQGGATWDEVDQAAAKEGLAVVGCTTSAAGVGGTTLGAAIRGAGQSFGVVTESVMRAHPQRPSVFGGFIYLPVEQLTAVVEFANQFDTQTTGDEALFFGFTTRPRAPLSTVIVALLLYNEPSIAAEAFFAPLLALKSIRNETHEMPYPKMNTILGWFVAPGTRKSISGTTFTPPLDLQLMQEVHDDFDKFTRTYPRVEGSAVVFELIPYTCVNQISFDATAYANRGQYHNVMFIFRWYDQELDMKMVNLERAMTSKTRDRAGVVRIAGQGVGSTLNSGPTWWIRDTEIWIQI